MWRWRRGPSVPRRNKHGLNHRKLAAVGHRAKRDGARGRNRTADTMIFSHVLYQLSYPGLRCGHGSWANRSAVGGGPMAKLDRHCNPQTAPKFQSSCGMSELAGGPGRA